MEKKTKISVSIKELSALVHLLNHKEKEIKASMLIKDTRIPLKATLLEDLNDDEKENFIRLEVKKVLEFISGVPVDDISDNDKLTGSPLHLSSNDIRSLANPFTEIARNFNSDATITPDECEECDTVNDCVNLILSKI